MKFIKEKHYWNFCLGFFLVKMRLNVLGMCINVKQSLLLPANQEPQ